MRKRRLERRREGENGFCSFEGKKERKEEHEMDRLTERLTGWRAGSISRLRGNNDLLTLAHTALGVCGTPRMSALLCSAHARFFHFWLFLCFFLPPFPSPFSWSSAPFIGSSIGTPNAQSDPSYLRNPSL